MRKPTYLLALAAVALLCACSSDDDVANSESTDEVANSYMTVQLYMSDATSTRSSSTLSGGSYEEGTTAEQTLDASHSIFLFYDSDGNYLTSGTVSSLTEDGSQNTTSTSDYAEYVTSATVVLGPTLLQPSQVIGIFNVSNTSDYLNLSISEVQDKLFTEDDIVTNSEGTSLIPMSNAVSTTDGSNFTLATSISESNISETASGATNDPVTMYIERAKARVKVSVGERFTTTGDGTYTYTLKELSSDGSSYTTTDRTFSVVDYADGAYSQDDGATVTITINGWDVNCTNSSGYIVKKYTDLASAFSTTWYSSYRIFWAEDGNYLYTEDAYKGDTDSNKDWYLDYMSWNDVSSCSTDAAYYYENTVEPESIAAKTGKQVYSPTLLVAATVEYTLSSSCRRRSPRPCGVAATVEYTLSSSTTEEETTESKTRADDDDTDGTTTAANIYTWGGAIYTEAAIYQKVLEALESIEGVSLSDETVSTVTWETADASYGSVKVSSITMSNNTEVSAYVNKVNESSFFSTTSTDGTTTYNVRLYTGGACYYQVPIQTYISSTEEVAAYGLVRNTAYSITINSVTDIGGGVVDKDKDLTDIPGEDTNYYIAAKINVLAWRTSSQSVDL